MTDATHPVTQSALESFTREYLTSLGASIRTENNRWAVRLPAHVDIDVVDTNEFQVLTEQPDSESTQSGYVLTPESEFTQQLLDEAADVAILGQLSLTEEVMGAEYQYPPWITESPAEVIDARFNPYYDRTGVCVFVKISVETVSEYQTQLLEAVTVDVESNTQLPGVADILVEKFYEPGGSYQRENARATEEERTSIQQEKLSEVIDTAQQLVVADVQEQIDEIRHSASRSADSEFEEYRQLQEQRNNELKSEIASLSSRLQDLSTDVDTTESQQERVDLLETRQELQEEKEKLQTELEELRQKKDRGFIQKKHEIYDRHKLSVSTKPVAVTIITYERGELEVKVQQSSHSSSIRTPYAIGAGVVDHVTCDACGANLSEYNPLQVVNNTLRCSECYDQ